MTLLLASTLACAKPMIKADVYCPRPERPVMQMPAEDKIVLQNYLNAVDYCLKLESTIKCYEDATK